MFHKSNFREKLLPTIFADLNSLGFYASKKSKFIPTTNSPMNRVLSSSLRAPIFCYFAGLSFKLSMIRDRLSVKKKRENRKYFEKFCNFIFININLTIVIKKSLVSEANLKTK